MKNKKKIIVIFLIVLFILTIATTTLFLVKGNNRNTNIDNKENNKAPAENTEELLKNSNELTNAKINGDRIEFDKNINVDNGEKIAIWIYTNAKFLGWFNVKEENGIKYIEGLNEAIENEHIDKGSHHLAIVNNEETLGYINIEISEENNVQEINAIKELGLPEDFYSFAMYKARTHLHFNKDYTFYIDNENVYMDEELLSMNNYFLADKIKFKSGTFSLIEKNDNYIKLNLIFKLENDETKEANVAIYKKEYNEFGTYYKMEADMCAFNIDILLLGSDVKFTYTFMNDFGKIYYTGC